MASLVVGSFSSSLSDPRTPMIFTNKWGEGDVFQWYRNLRMVSKRVVVNRLQVRIDHGKPPHRFVLAYLGDGAACRFDRRPDETNAGAVMLDTINRARRKAADEYRVLREGDPELLMIQNSTICEIDMNMPPTTDLIHILSACFALSQDTEARDYDLLRYNCYFFSWTLTTVVVRHVLPFHLPTPDDVAQSLNPALGSMSQLITDNIVKALLGIVLDVIAAARQEAGDRIKKGLYLCERLIWKLPMSIMCFSYRQILKLQLYFGLEDTIRKKTHERMLDICTTLLRDVLSQEDITKRVEKRLWINELKDDIRAWFRDRMAIIFWDAVLDIIATVHGNVDGQKALADIENNPSRRFQFKVKIFGDAQWIQLWNEALSAALPAARDAVRNQARPTQPVSREFHDEIFNTAFTAANGAALAAAKDVATRSQSAQNNPKRAEMWEAVWDVWDDIWRTAHEKTRVVVVPIFEQIVEEIATLVTDQVLVSVRGSQGQKVEASVQYNKGKRTLLTTSEFQEHIGLFVKSAYPTAGQRAEQINAAMARAWDTASDALRLGLQGNS